MVLSTSNGSHILMRDLTTLSEYNLPPVFTSLRGKQTELAVKLMNQYFPNTHLYIQIAFLCCYGKKGIAYKGSLFKHRTCCQSFMITWITWGASVILKMLSEEGTLEEGERGTEEKTARITQEEVLTFSGKTMCRYRNEWYKVIGKRIEIHKTLYILEKGRTE